MDCDKVVLRQLIDFNFLSDRSNSHLIKRSLKNLSSFLYTEYGHHAVLLIDEYGVPLKKASLHDEQNKKLHKNLNSRHPSLQHG